MHPCTKQRSYKTDRLCFCDSNAVFFARFYSLFSLLLPWCYNSYREADFHAYTPETMPDVTLQPYFEDLV